MTLHGLTFPAQCATVLAVVVPVVNIGGVFEWWWRFVDVRPHPIQNKVNQETLHWGKHPTPLRRLCWLPFRYFSDHRARTVLFPALIAATAGCPLNRAVIVEELSCDLFKSFILANIADRDKGARTDRRLVVGDVCRSAGLRLCWFHLFAAALVVRVSNLILGYRAPFSSPSYYC